MSGLVPVFAALSGTLVGILGHYFLVRRGTQFDRGAMETALVAEVSVLRDLLLKATEASDRGPHDGRMPAAAILPFTYHGALATVYDGLSPKLGMLDRDVVQNIVRFHTLYKILVGAAEKQGTSALNPHLVKQVIRLGDDIEARFSS